MPWFKEIYLCKSPQKPRTGTPLSVCTVGVVCSKMRPLTDEESKSMFAKLDK